MEKAKKTYVLVHGAWHTKRCWDRVVEGLNTNGCDALAIDLPGHGDNKKAFRSIRLKTYVDAVISQIVSQNQKVVLVGHSMGGMVISQAAEQVPHLIERLVYVTGFLPKDGESLNTIVHQFPSHTAPKYAVTNKEKMSISLSHQAAKDLFYKECSQEDIDTALAFLQEQPLLPFQDEVTLTDHFRSLPKVFIACLKDQAVSPEEQKFMYSRMPCDVHMLTSAGHSPFYSHTNELVDILLKAPTRERH